MIQVWFVSNPKNVQQNNAATHLVFVNILTLRKSAFKAKVEPNNTARIRLVMKHTFSNSSTDKYIYWFYINAFYD